MHVVASRRFPLYALLSANGISQVGNAISYVALPWFVLATTGSAARTAVTAATETVPLVLTGLFGGALVDRAGYRRMSVISDIASAVAVAAVPALYHTVGLAFWQLLVLVFLGAVLDSPGAVARRALYPDLAREGGIPLERANATSQIVFRSAGLIGPPLSGVLIAALGPSNVLWLDAVSFLISAAIVVVAVPACPATARASSPVTPRALLGEVAEGLRFVRGDRVIFAMLLTLALGSVLAEPLYPVVLPVYAREVYGSALNLGVMFAALAGGSIAGNLLYLRFGRLLSRRLVLIGGYAIRGGTFWLLISLPPIGVVAAAIVLNATFFEPVNPVMQTVMQERTPDAMRGRVFGALAAVAGGVFPLGILTYGALLAGIGLRPTLIVLALVNLLPPLWMLLTPTLRRMEAPATATVPDVGPIPVPE